MDIVKANECLRHSYGPPKKGVFDNQEVGEVEGEPAAPTISPVQASAARKAAETLPQPPTSSEDTWGSGFDEEFDAIEGFEVESEREATPDGEVVAIEEAHVAVTAMLAGVLGREPTGLTDENLQSRLRGVLLMGISNAKGWIVLTTGNKSEMATGYSTL